MGLFVSHTAAGQRCVENGHRLKRHRPIGRIVQVAWTCESCGYVEQETVEDMKIRERERGAAIRALSDAEFDRLLVVEI